MNVTARIRVDNARVRILGVLIAMVLAGVVGFACGDDDDHEHPQGIGNHCEKDDDCPTRVCYLGPGGGYCTSPCATEGDTGACPVDTVFKPIQGGQRPCLLVCGSDSTCD